MAIRQYIGARYVTKIYENSLDPSSAEWESGVTYEPLTLVTYLNSSYLSKKEVPGSVGDPAANPSYWVLTGAYNGQILNLQNQINATNDVIAASKVYVTPEEFGAVGDGVNDDTAAIQAAIEAAYTDGKLFKASGKTYKVTSTIYLPVIPATHELVTIDFNGSTLKVSSDFIVLESAYVAGGVYVPNYGTADDSHMNFKTVLKNVKIYNDGGTTTTAIRIKDWHQLCMVEEIYSNTCANLITADNCYYTVFKNLMTMFSTHSNSTGMIFSGAQNLNVFENLISANYDIGYTFGPCSGVQIRNCSGEGSDIAMQFNNEVYALTIDDCYFENFTTAINFVAAVYGCGIRGNYFNFLNHGNAIGIQTANVASNNVNVDASNMFINLAGTDKKFNASATPAYSKWNIEDTQLNYSFARLIRDDVPSGATLDQVLYGTYFNALVANKNNFIPGHYSGKYSGNYDDHFGFDVSGGVVSTKIQNSATQLILFNATIVGGTEAGIKHALIFQDSFYEFGSGGVSKNTNITIGADGDGFMTITIPGMTNVRGTVRIL